MPGMVTYMLLVLFSAAVNASEYNMTTEHDLVIDIRYPAKLSEGNESA